MAQKLLHLRRQSQKIRNPQPKKIFLSASRRLSNLFEPLNSSLAQWFSKCGTRGLFWWYATSFPVIFEKLC